MSSSFDGSSESADRVTLFHLAALVEANTVVPKIRKLQTGEKRQTAGKGKMGNRKDRRGSLTEPFFFSLD